MNKVTRITLGRPAPTAMIIKAIRCAYDAAEAARGKPPNVKELPAAVQPFLRQKGFSASGRHNEQLGDAEEFKMRRRPPGKPASTRNSRPRRIRKRLIRGDDR
jgi:hypothetical protein